MIFPPKTAELERVIFPAKTAQLESSAASRVRVSEVARPDVAVVIARTSVRTWSARITFENALLEFRTTRATGSKINRELSELGVGPRVAISFGVRATLAVARRIGRSTPCNESAGATHLADSLSLFRRAA